MKLICLLALATMGASAQDVVWAPKPDVLPAYTPPHKPHTKLSDVKAKYLERQTQANNYKHRVDVIDSLRAGQAGPVNLLAMLGETVNGTEAVWLRSMDDTGPSLSLEGTALSTDAVANLIANLQKTGFFKTVEIKETFQDEQIKDMQAFQFTLTCEKGKS